MSQTPVVIPDKPPESQGYVFGFHVDDLAWDAAIGENKKRDVVDRDSKRRYALEALDGDLKPGQQ
jgi:hypothetical protein